ncbi:hypothetical protein PUN28_001585 [Cardiocondyla obscurior]|uniref:Uncharacterized protein n=1 Tax=Cardiocondyla obscurior TaxID=286306 RepID=A0AAW2H5S2_9HYME
MLYFNVSLRLGKCSSRSILRLTCTPFDRNNDNSLFTFGGETRACKKSNSPFYGEGRRGKLEGEKLRSFMSFFVTKCEGDGCTARVFMRRIYRDRL